MQANEARWAISSQKQTDDEGRTFYMEGYGEGVQVEAHATGALLMYDGTECKELVAVPKLWEIRLSGHHMRVRNGGHEASYHVLSEIHPQHLLVVVETHTRAVLGPDNDRVEYFIQHAVVNDENMAERRFWARDLLEGSPPDDKMRV